MSDNLVIYHADPVTGEYIGFGVADPDPLEQDRWLIPAGATAEKPPTAGDGYVAAYTPNGDGTWTLLLDLRGIVYSTKNGEASQWDRLGPLPDELTKDPRPSIYHIWLGGKWVLDKDAESKGQVADATDKRDDLLRVAALRIAPLQDAIDLDEASDEDIANLRKWKQYRVSLNKIESQQGFPARIDWPSMPA